MKTLFATLCLAAFVGLCTPALAGITPAGALPQGQTSHAKAAPFGFASKPKPGTKARCPVMKAEFTIDASSKHSLYKGRYYFFCCPGCKPKFDANPGKYTGR